MAVGGGLGRSHGAGTQPWGRGSSGAVPVPAPSPCPRSFVAGVIHPWRVSAFERLLWRACRGYLVASFVEMPEPMEDPATVSGALGWGLTRKGGGGTGTAGADVGCAVPRARASLGSSSSSPTGVSRLGRRSARSQTGEPAAPHHASGRVEVYLSKTHSGPRHGDGLGHPAQPWHPLTRWCPICPSFHCHVYPYPESEASRADTMSGLHSQIQDLSVVSWTPQGGLEGVTPGPPTFLTHVGHPPRCWRRRSSTWRRCWTRWCWHCPPGGCRCRR